MPQSQGATPRGGARAARIPFATPSLVVALALGLTGFGCSGARPDEGGGQPCGLAPGPRPDLLLAGSGANLALVRAAVARFAQDQPELRIDVPPSIGTGGALRAVLDGVVDLGLTSRPLKPEELARGLVYTPLARVPVVLAAGPGVPEGGLEPQELRDLLLGPPTRWRNGLERIVLLREPGDSSNRVLRQLLPGFGAALERSHAAARWRVCTTDQEMAVALAETPGAVGLIDLGTLRLDPAAAGVRPLRLGSYDPPLGALGEADYPFMKELGFASLGPPAGLAAQFLDFVASPSIDDLLARGGYRRPRAE